jgi:hypothetical protein
MERTDAKVSLLIFSGAGLMRRLAQGANAECVRIPFRCILHLGANEAKLVRQQLEVAECQSDGRDGETERQMERQEGRTAGTDQSIWVSVHDRSNGRWVVSGSMTRHTMWPSSIPSTSRMRVGSVWRGLRPVRAHGRSHPTRLVSACRMSLSMTRWARDRSCRVCKSDPVPSHQQLQRFWRATGPVR